MNNIIYLSIGDDNQKIKQLVQIENKKRVKPRVSQAPWVQRSQLGSCTDTFCQISLLN